MRNQSETTNKLKDSSYFVQNHHISLSTKRVRIFKKNLGRFDKMPTPQKKYIYIIK